jgi:hypothetical protein
MSGRGSHPGAIINSLDPSTHPLDYCSGGADNPFGCLVLLSRCDVSRSHFGSEWPLLCAIPYPPTSPGSLRGAAADPGSACADYSVAYEEEGNQPLSPSGKRRNTA